jgi:hypothetical protein
VKLGNIESFEGINHFGQFVHAVDRSSVPVTGSKQQDTRCVGENRGRRDKAEYGERVRRQIHSSAPWAGMQGKPNKGPENLRATSRMQRLQKRGYDAFRPYTLKVPAPD